jgi:KDO2-lipid IV(A) lauroyltransferase
MGWKRTAINAIARFSAPGWRAKSLAGFLGFALACTRPREREALANLALAYPDSDEAFRMKTLREVYDHLAWMTAEYLALQRNPSQCLSWVQRVVGEEFLREALEAGKGAIILTGHMGNWELLAAWLCRRGYPVTAIVRDPDDTDFRETIADFRTRVGLKTLPKTANMKAAVNLLRKGGFLGILSDQLAGRNEGLPVPFMGHPAYTFAGAASLGILTGCPILPVFSFREAPFRHRIEIAPPLPFPEGTDRKERILDLTLRCNEAIEDAVRRTPGQWLWLHRRWGRNLPSS